MEPFFKPKTKRKIEVKVVRDTIDYYDIFTAYVSSYEEVMEVDQFVRRFIPGHHLKTKEIIEEEKDETVEIVETEKSDDQA